jgi:hypothetical protein
MKLLDELRLFLRLETYPQQYARKSGFKIVKVKNIGVDLYCGDEILGHFPSELAASSRIYYLNACAGVSR